jgi:NAD(P)H-dependent flavin oxidoreductase YrpB (nitropropane dioxygenase family)
VRTRELTDRPFGANVILDDQGRPELAAAIAERCLAVIEERVPLLVLFEGDPGPFVEPAHAAGVKVAIQIGSPAAGREAAAAGVDLVIAQGIEAGGHVAARTGLFVNLPRVVDTVAPVPVVASGGIANGRGLAAALVLGAAGVSLGTRFVASEEAFVREDYKQRVVEAGDDSTIYTEDLFDVFWPDVPHRTLKARTYAEWDAAGRPPFRELEIPRYASFMLTPWFDGDVDLAPMWAGESVALVDAVLPAGEIVRRIAAEADEVLARVSGRD